LSRRSRAGVTNGRLPLHLAAVFFPEAVVAHGGGSVFEGLGDEAAVEGIAVVVESATRVLPFMSPQQPLPCLIGAGSSSATGLPRWVMTNDFPARVWWRRRERLALAS